MPQIVNASPADMLLGANDLGAHALPVTRDAVPQHVPLIFMYAQKGTPKRFLGTGAAAVANYGRETFNPDGVFYKHTTRLANELYGVGNACQHQRVVPADASDASVIVYADVLSTTATVGGVANTPVNYVKFIAEPAVAGSAVGSAVAKPGTYGVGAGAARVTSTMTPILEQRSIAPGAAYNDMGFTIESLLTAAQDSKIIANSKALTYNLGLVTRGINGGAPVIRKSLYGEPAVACTLVGGVKDPVTGAPKDIAAVFDANWFNETNPLLPVVYRDYSAFHVYQANIDALAATFLATEKTHVTAANLATYDFTTADPILINAEAGLINFFTCQTTGGTPYVSILKPTVAMVSTLAAGQTEVVISKNTPIYMTGGSDGTLSDANFEALVQTEMAKYLDPNSNVIDNAVNVETHLYDSGFTGATKPFLLNFMAVRKDTIVALGTHEEVAEATVPKTLSAARATATALKTAAMLFPESDFFGTSVARAIVVSGAYRLNTDIKRNFHSALFEVAIKTAKLMGAGNYKWNATYNFDHGPAAVLQYGSDYQPAFIPAGVKPQLWNDGMIWAQPKDRVTYFIPAMQTVYPDDTSPLNSWLTICALVTLNRIASDAWRQFTGTATMTDAVFIDNVTNYLNGRLAGIFDNLVTVVPEVIITQADAARGYSWQIRYRLYAGTMKTVMVSYTDVYRLNAAPVV